MYKVKAVKSFMRLEGYGYNCNLYRDGKKVAEVINMADGGEVNFNWKDDKELHLFAEYTGTLPMIDMSKWGMEPLPASMDMAVGQLVDEYEDRKRLKSLCTKNWVYKMKGQEEGTFATLRKGNPKMKMAIETKFKNQIVECLTDRI